MGACSYLPLPYLVKLKGAWHEYGTHTNVFLASRDKYHLGHRVWRLGNGLGFKPLMHVKERDHMPVS
jgi:hypothetical protein